MIIVDSTRDFLYHVNRAQTTQSLTQEQKDSVKAYIQTNCAGMSNEEIVEYLAMPREVPVDLPRIDKESVLVDEVWVELNSAMITGVPSGARVESMAKKYQELIDADNIPDLTKQENQILLACWQLYQAKISSYKSIDLSKDSVKQWKILLVSLGLLSAESVDKLLSIENPQKTEIHPSPLVEDLNFMEGTILDAVEVAGLVG